jgi:histidyl-tRNA synthetase
MNTFMLSQRSANFDFGEDDILNQLNEYSTILIDRNLIDKIDLIDSDGTLKIEFGDFAGGFTLKNVNSIRSLKNIPKKCNDLQLLELSIKHTDFQNFDIKQIEILQCPNVNKISNINTDVLEYFEITDCKKIKRFNQIPLLKSHTELVISDINLNRVKNDNDSIYNLKIIDVTGLNDLYNLSSNLEKLVIRSNKDFKSFRGIETYDNLIEFETRSNGRGPIGSYDNIINILLCKKLNETILGINEKHIFSIMKRYINIDLSERSNHIMDCAVELIDAGFPEAAEL